MMRSMSLLTYSIHIERADEGGFYVFVPALPGCQTQARTFEEALVKAKMCIESFLEALAKADEPIPIESQTTRPVCVLIQVNAPELT